MVRILSAIILFLFMMSGASAQCFQVLDGNGVLSNAPYFINCGPGTYSIFVQTNIALGPYTIDWGDGTAVSSGPSLVPPAFVTHNYAATTDTFNIVITEPGTGCVINGVVVMERNPLASIQLPAGDDNFGCTPILFRFINSATQVSQTTRFTWTWGDGSPVETYDYTNLGDTVLHTYLPGLGTASCDLEVRLAAANYCGTSTASFFPLKVWDLDEAVIVPSATLLCYPDTVVQYTNQTIRNCFAEGNQTQRFELWNFGDYWGLGRDSIIGWRPWNPPITLPPPMAYPGVGTYNVMLVDSSFCGLDTTVIAITITNPPTAVLSTNKDTLCEGESVTFTNSSFGGANVYAWDFDNGAGFQNLNAAPKTRTYTTAGDYTIRLAVGVAGANGCSDTAEVNIHVNPSPAADFSFDNNNFCDTMTVHFTDLSAGVLVDWQWDFDNGTTFNGQNPPSQFYPAPGIYDVKLVTTNSSGCKDSIIRQVRVREFPNADFTVSSVCLNLPANFIDQSTFTFDPIAAYKWYFGDGDSSIQQDPTHIYGTSGAFDVTLIVDNGFCTDTTVQSFVVEVPPDPAFLPDTSEGCSPLRVAFTNFSSVNAIDFRWNFGDGSAIDTARSPIHIFNNNSSLDTNFYISLVTTTAFGCVDTAFDTVSVYPVPQPSFTSDAVIDCGPLVVNFTNTTAGNNLSFVWNFGDGSPTSTQRNPTHIFENQTLFINNYVVELVVISANGCTDTTRQNLTVYPEPNFTFAIVPDSGCSPLRVQFPSVVGAVSYQWDFGDGSTAAGPTPTHVFVNNTANNRTFNVRLIAQNSFGCLDTNFGSVLVFPNPTSNFVLDTNRGCQPLPISITNLSQGANNYYWSFGDGTTSTSANANFVKTYTNLAGSTAFNDLRLITETNDGCRDTLTRQVEVHPFIQAAFLSDSAGCSPYQLGFLNQSIGASAYFWDFDDNSSSSGTSPSHRFLNSSTVNQTFNTSLVATSPQGCLDTAERGILVYPKPIANFVVSDSTACHPVTITFTNNSVIADSCRWRFGDGTDSITCLPNVLHTYENTTSFLPINYQSQLFVFTDEGCRDTLAKSITVYPRVIASFTSDTAGCSPLNLTFRNQSTAAQNFIWTYGDGANSIQSDPTHIFTNSGQIDTIFNTELKVISQYGCADSTTQNITVFAKPTADFVVDVNQGCQPLEVNFTNQSFIRDSCYWEFGDGNSLNDCSNLINYTYTNLASLVPVNYPAKLKVITDRGCTDEFSRIINVNPQVIADFSIDADTCSPVDATFRSQSFGATQYTWRFGDGNISNGLITTNRYINVGSIDATYNVRLIATSLYQCSDTMIKTVLVRPTPVPNFDLNPMQQKFPAATINVNNTTNAGNWSYLWDFGDTTTSTLVNPADHTYGTWGNYIVKLVARSPFCADSTTKIARIIVPDPIADFTDSASGCEPLEVQFLSNSQYASSYEWDFGDGGTSSSRDPFHTYFDEGIYDVTLTVRGFEPGLSDIQQKTEYIRVYKTPRASFFNNKDEVFIPNDPIVFSNTSFDADDYLWDFGDGNTSTEESPTYFYTTEGDFEVYLVASTTFGCSDTFFLPNTVFAQLKGEIKVPNAFTPNPNGPNSGMVNPASSAELNDVFYAKMNGVVEYELNIFNKWGELIFVSKDLNMGWNGYYRGELCQQDVYVWKIKAEFADGREVVKVGDLMLLR